MEKNKKRLIFFMPSMEGGGVEKNLILIANYISKFRDKLTKMNLDKGLDLQECEKDIFNNYRGRWSK